MGNRLAARSRAWRWLELGLLGAGILLLGIWVVARVDSELGRRAALKRFEALRAKAAPVPAPAPEPPPDAAPTAVPLRLPATIDSRLWSEKRIRDYEASQRVELGAPLAVLRVPAVGIEVAVLPGTDDVTLNRAVGWIQGTALPGAGGNVGIAGHRDGFFRALKDVTKGDRISLETPTGSREYVIADIHLVKPSEVSVLEPTAEPTLTLVTCFPFYFVGDAPQRYIVRAVAEGTEDSTPSALR
jgi:sortase A